MKNGKISRKSPVQPGYGIKGFHDEALVGKWEGYRSSRLGLQYRVIYRVVPAEQLFQVASITAHDYRRS